MNAGTVGNGGPPQGAGSPVGGQPAVRSSRLLTTLGVAGALAGLAIVLVYGWAEPRIEGHRERRLRTAIEEVLHAPAHADTLYLAGGALGTVPERGADRVYRGVDAEGRPVGYAITTSKAGFADQIVLIFGYDPQSRRMLGIKILETKETPGLGDKIEKAPFTDQFPGRRVPLTPVKGAPPAGDTSAVAMITGATISARTVVDAINAAVARWQPFLEEYERAQRGAR